MVARALKVAIGPVSLKYDAVGGSPAAQSTGEDEGHLDAEGIGNHIRSLGLEDLPDLSLNRELDAITAEYAAHLVNVEQRLKSSRRQLAGSLIAAGLLGSLGAFTAKILVYDIHGPIWLIASLMLFLMPVFSLFSASMYFIRRSQLYSRSVAEIARLQIVGGTIKKELQRRAVSDALRAGKTDVVVSS